MKRDTVRVANRTLTPDDVAAILAEHPGARLEFWHCRFVYAEPATEASA